MSWDIILILVFVFIPGLLAVFVFANVFAMYKENSKGLWDDDNPKMFFTGLFDEEKKARRKKEEENRKSSEGVSND